MPSKRHTGQSFPPENGLTAESFALANGQTGESLVLENWLTAESFVLQNNVICVSPSADPRPLTGAPLSEDRYQCMDAETASGSGSSLTVLARLSQTDTTHKRNICSQDRLYPESPRSGGPKHSPVWRPEALSSDLLYAESPRLDRPEARFVHLAARSTLQRSFVSRVTPVPDRPEACPVRNLYIGDHPVRD